ncbi:MAG: cation/acetate symporter ActP [Gammaproteobacteria bacterium]|nr:cation/acetate symporter ActP [Gammaproteobacteria bacterium]
MSLNARLLALLIGAGLPLASLAETPAPERDLNTIAIGMFLVFVMISLGITFWAARRTRSTSDFLAAGGRISGFQNGLAITGDWVSSAALMGIAALIYSTGFDGLIYSVVPFGAWPLMMFLMADRLRNLGKYTIADIVSVRFSRIPMRTLISLSSLVFVVGYLIVQMVGAGTLISNLFGIDYTAAQVIIGILIVLYVAFGGMIATTYVQLVKAVLLLSGASFICFAALFHFDWSVDGLYASAISNHPQGMKIMQPGGLLTDPISAFSCGLMLMLGGAAMPHVLMRFFTVPDARQARLSVFYAASFIGYFYLLTFIIGYAAIAMVMKDPRFLDANGLITGGANMAAIHLSEAVGGSFFLGFISAVAFATIVAVVAGLTIAGASAISHDLYANIFRHGKATDHQVVKVSRISAVCLGAFGVVLGIAFKDQNIAYMITIPFTVSSSVFFPILFLSMYWRGLTTRGAVAGGAVGLGLGVILLFLGPTIWGEILGHGEGIFPYKYPALFTIIASFFTMIVVSKLDDSPRARRERAEFDDQFVRSQTGVGAEAPAQH